MKHKKEDTKAHQNLINKSFSQGLVNCLFTGAFQSVIKVQFLNTISKAKVVFQFIDILHC